MRKFKFIIYYSLFFVFVLNTEDLYSSEKSVDMFNPKKQTPNVLIVDNITKPDEFNKSNNLLRKAGSFKKAKGEPLYIKGVVKDAFGVPISNVKIKIWQTNSAGKYQNLLNKFSPYYDKNFLTSGESITDNMGKYEFITVFPGFYDDRAPHINMVITHEKFGIIETEFYFKGHFLNEKDVQYLSYSEEDKKALTANVYYLDDKDYKKGKIAVFNIIMDGIHEYKRF